MKLEMFYGEQIYGYLLEKKFLVKKINYKNNWLEFQKSVMNMSIVLKNRIAEYNEKAVKRNQNIETMMVRAAWKIKKKMEFKFLDIKRSNFSKNHWKR
jgi:hypothetical protein